MSRDRPGPERYSGGPHGVGDPNDQSLRKVEMDVLIPKKMRDKARTEKCIKEVADFTECCKSNGVSMVFYCRKENAALKECLTKWYTDESFRELCKKEYLAERTLYRSTGIPTKERMQRIGSNV